MASATNCRSSLSANRTHFLTMYIVWKREAKEIQHIDFPYEGNNLT